MCYDLCVCVSVCLCDVVCWSRCQGGKGKDGYVIFDGSSWGEHYIAEGKGHTHKPQKGDIAKVCVV